MTEEKKVTTKPVVKKTPAVKKIKDDTVVAASTETTDANKEIAVAPKKATKTVTKVKKNPWKSQAVGKRKSSIAKVWIADSSDKGSISINDRTCESFFGKRDVYESKINQPFLASGIDISKLVIKISVIGGGLTGCIDAIRLGLARAIVLFATEDQIRLLKDQKLLTRDSRVVESKKYGRRKARKKEQFSKR